MSGFEGSAEAAWLNGAIGKRAGLIQGRNEGAAIGYEAGWEDGLAEGQQQAARAAQSRFDAMQAQVEALQAELTSTRAAYQRVHAKWTEDKQFLAGLIVVATAAQEALATATPAQRVEFLTQYARGSKLFKAEGHIACEPAQSPRFRQDMPATVSFVNHLLNVAKAPALSASSTLSPLKGPAMRHQKLTFMQAAEMRCEPPSAVRTAHIVSMADGFQLLVKLVNESGDWTLTSPGGIADTFPDLGRLQAFATTVLGGQPLPVVFQPANQSPVQHLIA